jgi:hypothetical protein
MRPFTLDRIAGALSFGALLLGGAVHGCTMIVDAEGYPTCRVGSEACACLQGDRCEEGLECRQPGLCVRPPAAGAPP